MLKFFFFFSLLCVTAALLETPQADPIQGIRVNLIIP